MSHDCSNLGFATRAIHAGYDSSEYKGALNVPLFMSSTYEFDTTQQGSDAFGGRNTHPIYMRLGSPTHQVLEERIANLEGGEAGAAFACGMGAISSVCWTLLHAGSHAIISDTLYGCTWAMFKHMKEFGIEIDVVSFSDLSNVFSKLRPDTTMVYFETPANPTNLIIDIKTLCENVKAKAPNCQIVCDNTFSTPAITRPLELGCDVVVHSATKYLSGHGDIIAGLAIGKADLIGKVKMVGLKDMTGAVMSPLTAHLLLRGIKTLELRMQRHSSNALKIAEFLEGNKHVKRVMFPFLKSNPQYELATKQMAMPHAIISFELEGTIDDAKRFMDNLHLLKRAVSLGDCETLIEHPASMTHATMSHDELVASGISETFIRLSAGLENIEDILADISQAMVASYGEK